MNELNHAISCVSEQSQEVCSVTVMTSYNDNDFVVDADGISNYVKAYKKIDEQYKRQTLNTSEILKNISVGKGLFANRKYDCIIGVSGGVDSTYLCLLAKKYNLNPLLVHFDNGWNSELAQNNIESIIRETGFDLETYVVDWNEFRSLQRAYLNAGVIDIEVLTDHGFMAALYKISSKKGISTVLAGMNYQTESIMPKDWTYLKSDRRNIRAIYEQNSKQKFRSLKSYPSLGYFQKKIKDRVAPINIVAPLNHMTYNYNDVKSQITEELNWRDYGGKHFESVWTRFYQGYILPVKFGVDKRRAHYSNLILSQQLSRIEALKMLEKPAYIDESQLSVDFNFVMNKLGFTESEFNKIMKLPPVSHKSFPYQKGIRELIGIINNG